MPYLGSPERRRSVLASPDELWSMLMSLATDTDIGTLYCVLDGLDECSHIREVTSFLKKRLSECNAMQHVTLRVVMLSRPIHAFNAFTQLRLGLDNDRQIKHDIGAYIAERMTELEHMVRMDSATKQYLHSELAQRAGGTFLWIGFAIAELLQQPTATAMKECLSQLPSGLPAFYARMLRHIPANRRSRCRIVLQWAASATRPLDVAELAGALDPHLRGMPNPNQENDTLDLLTECGCIVKTHDRKITLVHQSARDYLFRDKPDEDVSLC